MKLSEDESPEVEIHRDLQNIEESNVNGNKSNNQNKWLKRNKTKQRRKRKQLSPQANASQTGIAIETSSSTKCDEPRSL